MSAPPRLCTCYRVWRARAMHWPVYVCARAYRLGLALISRAVFAFELKSRRTAEAGVGAARPPPVWLDKIEESGAAPPPG